MTEQPPTMPPRGTVPGPSSSISERAVAVRDSKEQQRREMIDAASEDATIRGNYTSPSIAEREQRPVAPRDAILTYPSIDQPVVTEPRLPTPTGKIAGALAAVMTEVGTIKKSGFNKFHNYHYPKMEDILVVVTPLMGQNGLAVLQDEIEIRNIEGNRIAVAYNFTVYHVSGESLPPVRQSGMSMARDSKGNFDDKAVAKCHTNARKFFMQALFQIPTEVPDNEPDEGGHANQRERRAVPGPLHNEPEERQHAPGPRKLALGKGAGAESWVNAYIEAIGHAKTDGELHDWDALNDMTLRTIHANHPKLYERVETAFQRRAAQLDEGKPDKYTDTLQSGMPNPQPDASEAMNWVATQLQNMKTYEAGETFWNLIVAPRETEFEPLDWDMLMQEWRRFEARMAPPPDPEQ